MKTKKKTDERKYHKEYGLWSNTRFVLSSAWKYDKKIYLLTFLSIIIAPLSKYLWTILSKIVIDIATRERFYSKNILILGASVFTVVLILIGVIEIFTGNDRWWRETYVRIRLMSIKNSVSMKIDFAHLEDTDVLDCYQKAGNACSGDTNGVEGLLKSVLDFAVELSGMFAGLAIMATLNGWIVVAILFLTVIQGIFSNRINKNAKATVWDVLAPWWRKRAYMDRMSNDFSAAKDIRMFSLKEWILDKYRELNKERLAAQKRNELLWFYNGIFSTFTWILSQIVVYAWLLKSVVNGQMTAGNFSLYLGSSGVFFASASQVTGAITRLLARSREVDDFRSFIDFANTTGGACASGGNPVPKYDKYEFVFENVSFKYPGAEKYALKNLNITVKGGERLAVVGLNGAGKSTFIKLLLRLYKPTEGRILLNGTDISTFARDSYFETFSPLFQDVAMFALPLSINVSMNLPEETDKLLAEKSLRNAGLSEKLDSLSKGVDTELLKVIYDDGIDLSGGEKQKLALARALYKNSPVVVLDEPTAALDAIAESKLYQDFDKLIGGKTAVYISHRLSSTQFCNNIAMFKDGGLCEYGTHESLIAKKGEYAHMWDVQSQYYKDERISNSEC